MQNERLEKRKAFLINTAYIAVVALLVLLFFKYAIGWLMPFIVGFLIALAAHPMISLLNKYTRLNRKICACIILILVYSLIILSVWLVGARIVTSVREVFDNLPYYYEHNILPFIQGLNQTLDDVSRKLPPQVAESLSNWLENAPQNLPSLLGTASSQAITNAASATGKVPFYFISVVFTVLASFFISMDFYGIRDFIKKQLPPRFTEFMIDTHNHMKHTSLRILRTYLIIMAMTFGEVAIGLFLLRVDNAIGIAAIVAIVDILPVLGTGTILLPWAVFCLATQNYALGIGLIALYLIVLVVRNFTEPKILGDQLGLHPLVAILCLYLGYVWMGVGGMILFPVCATVIVELHRVGKIKLWE